MLISESDETLISLNFPNLAIDNASFLSFFTFLIRGETLISTFGKISKAISSAGGIISILSSPIGIAIDAITAFIAVGVLLYKNWDTIKEKANLIWNSVKSVIESVTKSIKGTISSTWNSIKSITENVWRGIKNAIEVPIHAAKNTVNNVINSIKGFFANLHIPAIKIPHIKLPHFSISGEFNIKPPSVPHLNVNWNEGTFQSEPVIKVYGSGDIKLKINDDEVTVKKVDEYVTVDSVLKDAYKDEILKNGDMIGEFPVFKVGENIMGFSQNVGKVEVRVNEVWI